MLPTGSRYLPPLARPRTLTTHRRQTKANIARPDSFSLALKLARWLSSAVRPIRNNSWVSRRASSMMVVMAHDNMHRNPCSNLPVLAAERASVSRPGKSGRSTARSESVSLPITASSLARDDSQNRTTFHRRFRRSLLTSRSRSLFLWILARQ